ncbi:MAG: hypothetical protein ACT443_13515 [Gemmatimonadota bacterium]
MFRKLALPVALALAFLSSACTEEDPTDVGDVLLPSGDVLTFEVVLPASAFLISDSSFAGYREPFDAAFSLIARSFENVLDANALLRFSLPPATIVVRTTGTTMVTDSSPRFPSGRMVVRFDTLTATPRPLRFTLFRTAEEWDVSATWTQRIDSAAVQLPWAMAGGTRGARIDTATWSEGDSVSFDVDSATLALWNDSTNRARGAILVGETAGSRVRMLSATVRVDARSSIRTDKIVNVDQVTTISNYVVNPTLASPSSAIRVGGIPTWRSFLRFRADLASLLVACNNQRADCRLSLSDAHINSAELLLTPVDAPAGFVPEDSVFIEARTITPLPLVPIERSPLSGDLAIARSELIAPARFRSAGNAAPVRLNITSFLAHLTDESIEKADRRAPWLALLQLPETGTAGLATFQAAPMLRLILTTTIEGR